MAYSLDAKPGDPANQLRHDRPLRRRQRAGRPPDGRRRAPGFEFALRRRHHRYSRPHGRDAEYPVGSVWIAVSSPLRTTTLLIRAGGSRNAVIRKAGTAAIELLEKELQASNKAE